MRLSNFYKCSLIYVVGIGICLCGCFSAKGNVGRMDVYELPSIEADWIRSGEAIEFEKELWYPQDRVDILLDSEVYLLGEYKHVQFFVDRTDVRPYNRIYTKFAKNKFRVFEKRKSYD